MLLLLAMACAPSPADEEARFLQELQSFRAAKDAAFLESDSPVPADKRPAMLPRTHASPRLGSIWCTAMLKPRPSPTSIRSAVSPKAAVDLVTRDNPFTSQRAREELG